MPKPKKKTLSRPPLPPPSLREQLGVPPDVTDAELADLMRPPLNEQPLPQYTFGSQNIGPTAIRVGSGIVGGALQGVGGPLGALGSMAATGLGEDLAQRAEIYEGIREHPDLGRVGIAGLTGAVPFPALRSATPLVREAGQAAFNTALPVGMVAAENLAEGRPQSGAELATAGGLGLLMHGGMRTAGAALGALAPRRARVQVEPLPLEQALGPDAGAAVWHGTGATWPPEEGYPIGRPSLEKVRTGTGGMAQGHGFYVAQSPKVGEYYKTVLSPPDMFKQDWPEVKKEIMDRARKEYQDIANSEAFTTGPYNETANKKMWDAYHFMNYIGSIDDPWVLAGKYRSPTWIKEFVKDAEKSGIKVDDLIEEGKGNLYALDLPDEHLDKMLDWDAPLDRQSEHVKKAIPDWLMKAAKSKGDTGAALYRAIVDDLYSGNTHPQLLDDLAKEVEAGRISLEGEAEQKASEWLLSKGIIGNKYLDAMSRPNNITEQRIIDALERHQGNKEAALDEFMRTFHDTPAAKAKARGVFAEMFDRLADRKYNLVLFDPSIATPIARNDQPVPLSVLTGKESVLAPILPPDVRPIGHWEGLGDQYNLRLPDGTEATFTVEPGGDFKKALADARKRYAGGGSVKDLLGGEKGMALIGQPAQKEPWQMTKSEWKKQVDSRAGYKGLPENADTSEIFASQFLRGRHNVELADVKNKGYWGNEYNMKISSPSTPSVKQHTYYREFDVDKQWPETRNYDSSVVDENLNIIDPRYQHYRDVIFSDRTPSKTSIFRGMAAPEFEKSIQRGHLESRGALNFAGQEGETYYSRNPDQAASYAGGFAPWYEQPSFEQPGYIVQVKRPPHAVNTSQDEVAIKGRVPVSDIEKVYELRLAAEQPGDIELRTDTYRNIPGKELLKTGSGSAPSQHYVVREVPKSEWGDTYHKRMVRQALSEGRHVPPSVLKEYPDLELSLRGKR